MTRLQWGHTAILGIVLDNCLEDSFVLILSNFTFRIPLLTFLRLSSQITVTLSAQTLKFPVRFYVYVYFIYARTPQFLAAGRQQLPMYGQK